MVISNRWMHMCSRQRQAWQYGENTDKYYRNLSLFHPRCLIIKLRDHWQPPATDPLVGVSHSPRPVNADDLELAPVSGDKNTVDGELLTGVKLVSGWVMPRLTIDKFVVVCAYMYGFCTERDDIYFAMIICWYVLINCKVTNSPTTFIQILFKNKHGSYKILQYYRCIFIF